MGKMQKVSPKSIDRLIDQLIKKLSPNNNNIAFNLEKYFTVLKKV
jgi:hypothetical protein